MFLDWRRAFVSHQSDVPAQKRRELGPELAEVFQWLQLVRTVAADLHLATGVGVTARLAARVK